MRPALGENVRVLFSVNTIMRIFIGPLLAVLLVGCANSSPAMKAVADGTQVCEDPRPQVCTMDYRPVCGNLADGSRKTYSNGCGACGDAAVVSWTEGACPE